jgi:peptide-methionine (S)-S-oxide reductase
MDSETAVQNEAVQAKPRTETALFGAGCFWGVEATFRQLPGVLSTRAGYSGGTVANPTYEQVCSDRTGHAETVEVVYDPARVTYEQLLRIFWDNHDPTTLNRQGPDVGSQYRSVIFYTSAAQRDLAVASLAARQASGQYRRPIVTAIEPARPFYPAEDYHQQYLEKRGLASCHIG